jgi:hypothetical protein
MTFSAWIAYLVEYARERPGRVATAAAASFALIVATLWLARLSHAPTPSPVDRTSASTLARYLKLSLPLLRKMPPSPADSERIELCGYGTVPVVNGSPQIPTDLQATSEAALDRLAADLAARSVDRERALGLYLKAIAARRHLSDQLSISPDRLDPGSELRTSA